MKLSFKNLTLTALAGATMLSMTAMAEAHGRKGGERERPTFEQLDLNGDGGITQAEIQEARQAAGAARFAETDTNGDGNLSREELVARADEKREGRVDRMIERLDANDDGMISQEELQARRGGGDRAEERGAKMFERADADGNGSISQEEWDNMPKRRGRN